MIMFIGWWQETGLALSACATGSSAAQLFSRPKHRHTAPARVFSRIILVDFRTEDQDGMCNALRVRWTIIPRTTPQPWIACSGCRELRAFQSSGRIRLNANGRRLDAWLIYRCAICEKTWNRPIFERQNVRDIDPLVLAALQSNDPHWIRTVAFDLAELKRRSQRVDEATDFDIEKVTLHEAPDWTMFELDLTVPFSTSPRLDRLLASELRMSRAQLQRLHEEGTLRANPVRADTLRRRIRSGMRITIDLSTEVDRERLWRPRATGSPVTCHESPHPGPS